MKHLVETALLTHGIRSVNTDRIRQVWQDKQTRLVWMEQGKFRVGNIEDYLDIRQGSIPMKRINAGNLLQAMEEKQTGALTASGTIKACEELGYPMAVTCGIGGLEAARGAGICPDLPVLADSRVTLLTTGPKDMLDRKETLQWLTEHGVRVLGTERSYCTGYVFCGEPVKLQGIYGPEDGGDVPMLLIHEIPEEKRIRDRRLLEIAVREGIEAEKQGGYYHPAINGSLDRDTNGYASLIQLESLYRNACLAERL